MTQITTTWSTNWMSAINGSAKISEISIPGTHDSCARHDTIRSQCQWFSIIQQLNRGIRFIIWRINLFKSRSTSFHCLNTRLLIVHPRHNNGTSGGRRTSTRKKDRKSRSKSIYETNV